MIAPGRGGTPAWGHAVHVALSDAAWLLGQWPREYRFSCIDIAKSGFSCVPMIITLECQALNKASSFIH
jgi:hypothetical protein